MTMMKCSTLWHHDHVELCTGDQDVLAPPGDVSLLKSALPSRAIVFAKEYENYSHLDFTWGMTAHKDVYKVCFPRGMGMCGSTNSVS